MSPGRILVFARAPIPGQAKTRLIPALGKAGAAQLHSRLVRHTLERLHDMEQPVELWCAPDTTHPLFHDCATTCTIPLKQQQGKDLGERMYRAFQATLGDAPWAILIGTDCPDLEMEDMEQAIDALESGMDAVIGPAYDGGYYLLGLRQSHATLFTGIPWGSDRVCAITRQRMNALGWRHSLLRLRHDLDRPRDLEKWQGHAFLISPGPR